MTFTTTFSPSLSVPDRQDIALFPPPPELTVMQAARLIDVSEGCIDELLDAGLIMFRVKNGERLVHRDRLLEYKRDRERRHAALDNLFHAFREAGMSDDYD